MRVLVTGHLGFIGRNFYAQLVKDGHDVFGVDTADPEFPMDCRVGFAQDSWPETDLVIHCAATIPPIDKRRRNDLLVADDFGMDSAMFQWALRNRPGKIVFFSSSAAYPIALQGSRYDQHDLVESDIDLEGLQLPDAMYGLTKLIGEYQAQEARKQGLDVLVVRPFSGYGSTQSLDYPFPAMIERAKNREEPFDIWGDGRQVRDMIHVTDIVAAVLAMVEQGVQGPVNLGTGVATTILELAQAICSAAGYDPEFRFHRDKPTGAFYRCCDPSMLHTIYEPQVTLAEGISRALTYVVPA